jgi:hypothetical protein
MKEMSAAKWFGLFLKIVLAGVVAVFVGSESLAFFNFIFPADKFYLAYTGFGLTMGAFLVYLYLLLKDAETALQRVIALLMMVVGLVGELATAGFGMLIEGWTKLGWQPAQSEYEFMILVIRIAVGIHGVSLVMYWFGDTIIELMGDHDNDGTPNFADPDYKKQNKGSTFRWPWQKKQEPVPALLPEPVRQFSLSAEELAEIVRAEIAKAAIGQGVPVNGNGAVDPTKAAP